ncbi:MAG: alpha-amylase, partial [Lachnospiraceae bacterium]|nr:alpha-amylase [Lachnospiraceae bacterium]
KETYDVVMEPVVTERKEYVPQEEIVTEEALMNVEEEPVENIVVKPELPIAEPHPEVISEQIPEPAKAPVTVPNKPYEEMTVEELQAAIIERMAKNGPVTEQMKKDVTENIWHDSLVTWIKSFN